MHPPSSIGIRGILFHALLLPVSNTDYLEVLILVGQHHLEYLPHCFPPNRLLRKDEGTQRRSSFSGACTPPFGLPLLFFAAFGDAGRTAPACGDAVRCVAAWALVASFLPVSASTSLKLS